MFVPFIGLFVTLTFLGARLKAPGMKELTDRREPLFMRISSAVCIASEANTILDIAQVATWAYKTATHNKNLLPYDWDNLWCPVSQEDLFTEKGLIVINNTETSLIALHPVCYEEDKPTWWNDVHGDENADENAATTLPSFKEFLDIFIVISCIALHSWTRMSLWGRSVKDSRPGTPSKTSDGSDEDTSISIQIHPRVDNAISRSQHGRVLGAQSLDHSTATEEDPEVDAVLTDNTLTQLAPETCYLSERQWALDLYRPQNRALGLIIRGLVASSATHTVQPATSQPELPELAQPGPSSQTGYNLPEQVQLERPNKKRKKNRPSLERRDRWTRKRPRRRESSESDIGDIEERGR
ncbi:hypothetical protein P875_00053479 [Aspergillus parasiticus SU-1]|uniref:Uncharacterized protein n=1 Tax=Aspergillus parasiticus (strain ATCC 56775 / NRRL 5862 / SRRC 143 / SU-1) TaxID=1403190 RepID=A0A0F0HXV0_ASPPU|nr:hypothetical protein P875_00053479 [Aspergillus parasiticus SU-1]